MASCPNPLHGKLCNVCPTRGDGEGVKPFPYRPEPSNQPRVSNRVDWFQCQNVYVELREITFCLPFCFEERERIGVLVWRGQPIMVWSGLFLATLYFHAFFLKIQIALLIRGGEIVSSINFQVVSSFKYSSIDCAPFKDIVDIAYILWLWLTEYLLLKTKTILFFFIPNIHCGFNDFNDMW